MRSITATVLKLRKALKYDAREPRFIATIPKKGYRLIASVSQDDNQTAPCDAADTDPGAPPSGGYRVNPKAPYRKGAIITVLAAVFAITPWLLKSFPSTIPHEMSAEKSGLPAIPSIAVLAWENPGSDRAQEFLADGITEDITTDFSRLSSLMVIASNSSLKYKGSKATPEEVGEDLNVRFVLKGSLRRMGEEISVNAQLVDTRTGFNTWVQRYDRKVSEVFAVQDEVTRSIVNALAIKLTEEEKDLVARHSTGNLKAYDHFQEGMRLAKVNTKEANEQARVLYRKAIEHDPAYGRVHGAMAYTLATDYLRAWTDAPIESSDRALKLAKHGVALDDMSPHAYWSVSIPRLCRGILTNAVIDCPRQIFHRQL